MKLSDFDFRVYHNIRNEYITDKYIISNLFNDLINGATDLIMDHEIELFTGFCDKNNKKIYEGDILKIKEDYNKTGKGFVQYHKGIFKIINKKSSHEYCVTYLGYILCRENIEIIGNIHENSELIKGIE